jgi:hypothetical protein
MKMQPLKKSEKILLGILAIIIVAGVYIFYFVLPTRSRITENQTNLETLKTRHQVMDQQLAEYGTLDDSLTSSKERETNDLNYILPTLDNEEMSNGLITLARKCGLDVVSMEVTDPTISLVDTIQPSGAPTAAPTPTPSASASTTGTSSSASTVGTPDPAMKVTDAPVSTAAAAVTPTPTPTPTATPANGKATDYTLRQYLYQLYGTQPETKDSPVLDNIYLQRTQVTLKCTGEKDQFLRFIDSIKAQYTSIRVVSTDVTSETETQTVDVTPDPSATATPTPTPTASSESEAFINAMNAMANAANASAANASATATPTTKTVEVTTTYFTVTVDMYSTEGKSSTGETVYDSTATPAPTVEASALDSIRRLRESKNKETTVLRNVVFCCSQAVLGMNRI